jgi:hypothetical protein
MGALFSVVFAVGFNPSPALVISHVPPRNTYSDVSFYRVRPDQEERIRLTPFEMKLQLSVFPDAWPLMFAGCSANRVRLTEQSPELVSCAAEFDRAYVARLAKLLPP